MLQPFLNFVELVPVTKGRVHLRVKGFKKKNNFFVLHISGYWFLKIEDDWGVRGVKNRNFRDVGLGSHSRGVVSSVG